MTNNAAERELRAVAIGRRNWTFAGSDEGGRRAATLYTLIATAKLNDVDPQVWLADVLARLPDHPAKRIQELLPWHWHPQNISCSQLFAGVHSSKNLPQMRSPVVGHRASLPRQPGYQFRMVFRPLTLQGPPLPPLVFTG